MSGRAESPYVQFGSDRSNWTLLQIHAAVETTGHFVDARALEAGLLFVIEVPDELDGVED